MKNIKLIIFLLIFTASCKTIEIPPEIKSISVEETLGLYNLNMLDKLDRNPKQEPKFTLQVIEGSSNKSVTVKSLQEIDLGLMLESELKKSGRINVLDSRNQDKRQAEINKTATGVTANELAFGEFIAAEYQLSVEIVSSSQQKTDEIFYDMINIKVAIQAKITNTVTEEVSLSINEEGLISEKLITDATGTLVSGAIDYDNLYVQAVEQAVNAVVKKMLTNFPAIGFVLENKAGVITSDLGISAGAVIGSKVAIIDRVGALLHPVSGKITSYDYNYLGFGEVLASGSTSSKIQIVNMKDDAELSDKTVIVLID